MKGFKQFILRGNVVDLAVGVVVGGAFGTIVSSLVKDVLTPFIAAIFKTPNFSGLTFTINGSQFMYGDFINAVVSFLIVAATIYYFVVLPINTLTERAKKSHTTEDPTTKKCPECLSEIPFAATRCAFCTANLVAETPEETITD
jgi:large conductance mechanosensitive channel